MVRSRAEREDTGANRPHEGEGNGWLARVVTAVKVMAEKVDRTKGNKAAMHMSMSMMHLLV